MTIKEFLQAGGQINPKFQLIDRCEDSYSKDDADNIADDATSDDLVQHSFDHDRYADEQVFDEKNEYFTITAPDGTILANDVTKDISDQIIEQYTGTISKMLKR